MTDTLIVLGEDETLSDLADNMERFTLRHLPVLDGDRLTGLVTHRDVLHAAVIEAARSPGAPPLRVREVMSRDLPTVSPTMPLTLAADLMIARGSGCVLVVDDAGTLLGIVTEHDYLKLARTLLSAQA